MYSRLNLTCEEKQVARKIDNYFKPGDMSFREKIFNALLIAQNELECHHFSTERERLQILHFKNTLDSLRQKFLQNYINAVE